MKPTNSLRVPFALLQGELVQASDERVISGKKCGCICPGCNEYLVANKGKKKAHHFSHEANSECTTGYESALHLAVKEVLANSKELQVKGITVFVSKRDLLGYEHRLKEELLPGPSTLSINTAYMEKRLDDIQPDVLVETDRGEIALEVLVTHAVDDEKKQKLKNHKLPTLELDFSDRPAQLDFDLIRERLAELSRLNWPYYPGRDELEEKLNRRLNEKVARINADVEAQRKTEALKRAAELKAKQEAFECKLTKAKNGLKHILDKQLNDVDYYSSRMLELAQQEKRYGIILNYFGVRSFDALPDYVNIPFDNEVIYLFDRRLWQAELFHAFILSPLNKERANTRFDYMEAYRWLALDLKYRPARFVSVFEDAEKLEFDLDASVKAMLDERELVRNYLRVLKLSGFLKGSDHGYIVNKDNGVFPALNKELRTRYANKAPDESSAYHRFRVPPPAILAWYKENPDKHHHLWCSDCNNIYTTDAEKGSSNTPCPECYLMGNKSYLDLQKLDLVL